MTSGGEGERLTAAEWWRLRYAGAGTAGLRRRVSGLGPAATAEFVVDLCGSCLGEYPEIDDEELASAGLALAHAPHTVAAAAALDWLEAGPSPARLGIACALLRGLWLGTNTRQCTSERALRLAAAYERTATGAVEEFRFAPTLLSARECGAWDGEAAGERLAGAFLRSVERLPPELAEPLRARFSGSRDGGDPGT